MTSKRTERIAKAMTDGDAAKPIPDDAWLSSGVTLLNLAVAGRPDGCIAKGQYLWFVGDSGSAKTWFAFQLMAEAAANPAFDKYRFIYDNVENGALFDVARYFGKGVSGRVESPHKDGRSSTYLEEVYYKLCELNEGGKPFIYVVDSWDFLDTLADEEVFLDGMTKFGTSKQDKAKGTMGMHKAKLSSANMKRAIQALESTGSILIGLSQTRDKVNSPFPAKVAGGGRVHKFGAHVELWTSIRGNLEKEVNKKKREYGKLITIDVQKNRVSGWEGKVTAPFLRGFGFDNVGACVDFLVDEGEWAVPEKGSSVNATDFGVKKRREDLIKFIEDDPKREQKLGNLVSWLWRKIDDATTAKRRCRYD